MAGFSFPALQSLTGGGSLIPTTASSALGGVAEGRAGNVTFGSGISNSSLLVIGGVALVALIVVRKLK